jgi:type I restriction enzyme S subunit
MKALDKRIEIQRKLIDLYKSLIKSLRDLIFKNTNWEYVSISKLIDKGKVTLNRGNIIPKKDKSTINKFPVYSSSVLNDGLMGYNSEYMFNEELITWSIDGGGNFFYRKKHKYSITNVSGYMRLDNNVFVYGFISEMLKHQHYKKKFDYQSKAHPSVIKNLYELPLVSLDYQLHSWENLNNINELLLKHEKIKENYINLKLYMSSVLFV